SLADRGAMDRAGTVDQPAGRRAVEAGLAFQRHDQVDLAQGVAVLRTGDIVHFNDINRVAVQVGARLYAAHIAYASMHVLHHPALFNGLLTGSENPLATSDYKGEQAQEGGLQR